MNYSNRVGCLKAYLFHNKKRRGEFQLKYLILSIFNICFFDFIFIILMFINGV